MGHIRLGRLSATKKWQEVIALLSGGALRALYLLGVLCVTFSLAIVRTYAGDPRSGIIGNDDRRMIEQLSAPWGAIGQINTTGYRRTTSCTGSLGASSSLLFALLWCIGAVAAEGQTMAGAHLQEVNISAYRWSSIAKLNNSVGGSCTAVTVEQNAVLTAAHCIYNRRTSGFLPQSSARSLLDMILLENSPLSPRTGRS